MGSQPQKKKNKAVLAAVTEDGKALGHQFAALCWRMHGDMPEVLLITSRDTGRWVLPKGWPMKNRSPADAAAREAWEEAGALGTVDGAPIGRFQYQKFLNRARDRALPCEVDVFPLRVEKLTDDYPERKQRRRKWFPIEKAARKVDEPGLKELLARFPEAVKQPQTADEPAGQKARA